MLGRDVQREIVLCISHCHEGQGLRRETKAIQRLQTGARSTTGPSSKHGSARPVADGRSVSDAYTRDRRTQPDRSSAVRWIWSDGRTLWAIGKSSHTENARGSGLTVVVLVATA